MRFKINYLNKEQVFDKPIELINLIDDKKHKYICAKVNNSIRELSYHLSYSAKVDFLTLEDLDAIGTYRRSLCFLISMACYHIYPKIRLRFYYSISRAMFFEIEGNKTPFTKEMLIALENEMIKIQKENYLFERIKIKNELAIELYKKYKFIDKLNVLKYRPEKTTHFYKCNDYYNYFYGRLVYSTSYINKYKLRLMNNGVLVQYPRAENKGEIPEYENTPVYLKALLSSQKWANEMKCSSIYDINEKIKEEKGCIDFINECEARHSRMLCELGNTIEKNINKYKLICIAGPSSSGKTTFANRLRVELLSRGIEPTMISLDNYYLPRTQIPKNEKGEYDFECIEALNINLFNKQMKDLTNGKEIDMPLYHFGQEGKIKSKKIKLGSEKQIVIIEGIHALNEKLTSGIKRENKYKIYISPQIQVSIDNDNPLSLTDLRLLRRITRDYKFRHTTALETIKMWPDVRNGEFKWIYKGIEEADYVFNSFSFYELCAYRKHTLPLLKEIKRTEILFPIAERLLRMLKFFKPMTTKWIPSNSLIREFIGGSCFE